MPTDPNRDADYDLQNVQNIEPEAAERLLEGRPHAWLVDCKPEPGAETLPPNTINIAPHRNVRVYEIGERRPEAYLLITCLLRGGTGPGGLLIDRAIVFDGEVLDMLDHLVQAFDEGKWSRGIKRIANIKATDEYEYVAQYLRELSDMLEAAAENRYAMEEWDEYIGSDDDSASSIEDIKRLAASE